MNVRAIVIGLSTMVLVLAGIEPATAQMLPGLDGLAQLRDGRTMRSSSTDPDIAGNADNRPLEPGQTIVLADLEGPGVITHIWNTIASQERGHARLLTLRMYWDGEEQPSVECPIGDFFGIGHGLNVPYSSIPVAVSSNGRGRNCYWPMPFRKSAKITLTNDGKLKCDAFYYYIDWQKVPKLDHDIAYFHVMYRQEHPVTKGKHYRIADIQGRGHYVGTVLNVRQHLGSWWGEGDDFFYIDGEETPSLMGTGVEDYFCDGWGFRTFSNPYYGAPLTEPLQPGARHSVYRWHIPDPVIFQKSLRVEIEHFGVTFDDVGKVKSGFEERFDDYSSVAYWYQIEPHAPFPAYPPANERLYRDFDTMIQGENLIDRAQVTGGELVVQEIQGAEKDAHLWWRATEPGHTLTIPIEVPESGLYEVTFFVVASSDYGMFAIAIDDMTIVERLDTFNPPDPAKPGEPRITFGENTIFDVPLEAGTRTLRFINREKHPQSRGFNFGLDGYILKKLPPRE